jgi:hypothetical protein
MCPFVDQSCPACAAHLTMSNIASAFAHCADRYAECPVYAQLVLHQTPRYELDPPAAVRAAS